MNKTTTSTQKVPTANIAVNKSRIKIYTKSGETPTYYLQKGQEFQIEFFNPTTNVVLAKIELNGKLISQTGLVLKPGERVFLDRYIDVAQKFLFDTYEVSNTEEVKEAIQNNGNLKVYFYNEEVKLPNITRNLPEYPTYPTYPIQCWYHSPSTTADGNSGSFTNTNYYHIDDTKSLSLLTLGFTPQESVKTSTPIRGQGIYKKIETGRIEQGSRSDQNLTYVNKDFYSWAFHTVEYKLLPVSQKTITVNDLIVKKYCKNCGGKVGKTDKFCSKCGTKI